VKRIYSVILCLAGIIFFQWNSSAWNDTGHMTIAAEAFRQLSPEKKAQAIEVLKNHPNYQEWLKAYHPNPNIDLGTYLFMRCSTWPDEVRGGGGPYDHANWHFIDYPLRPPDFAFEPDQKPTNNVLFGVAQCEQTLSDTNADPVLRAAYLSYLVHLIGDMHQPLHCESFYSDAYPNGDRGGNDFYVKLPQGPSRLHPIWDDLLGTTPNLMEEYRNAFDIQVNYPRGALPELRKDTTPQVWSLESRRLAIKYGYLNGHLKGSTDPENAPPLPDSYIKAATAVAKKQAALAGYRLSDEIEEYLQTTAPVSLLPPNTNAAAASLPAEISADQAANYYYEELVVTGKVVDVSLHSTIAILDLDKPNPDTPCTAVVFDQNFARFGDFQKYQGHEVSITGTITEYHDRPEIILESPRQINILDP
jgi:S1/P1 Nuclease